MKVRFGLRLLFILLTIVAVACAAPGIWRQFQFRKFISHADRDLRKLSDDERQDFFKVARNFDSMKRDPLSTDVLAPMPWFIWPVKTENQIHYLYLKGAPCYMIPGISSVEILLFDSWGRLINETEYSTGYRITIKDADIYSSNATEFVFRVESEPVINGRNTGNQYYALIRGQIVLVRLEDGSGKPIINLPDHLRIGNLSPEFVVDDWHKLLQSESRVEQLAAIEYLQTNPQPEATQLLRSLLLSEEPWIADAARLAILEAGEVALPPDS